MKTKKHTAARSTKVDLFQQEEIPSIQHSAVKTKNTSKHTKVSTHATFHSSTFYTSNKKIIANKKTIHGQQLQPPVQTIKIKKGLSSSKSRKKLKLIDLTNPPVKKKQVNFQEHQQLQKYDQYCFIDGQFVPVQNNDKQTMDKFLSQTAETSYDFGYRKTNTFKQIKNQPISEQSGILFQPFIQKQDKAVSSMVLPQIPATVEVQVQACPDITEIGMQYSQRKYLKSDRQYKQCKSKSQQTQKLTDLLFKLEFKHLADEKSFRELPRDQKDHFIDLLQGMIHKLSLASPRPPRQIIPTNFKEQQEEVMLLQQIHNFKPGISSSPLKQQQEDEAQVIEKLLMKRQFTQMSWVEDLSLVEDDKIKTSLLQIVNFMCHLFIYVQMSYTEEFLYMVRKIYGYTTSDKYKRIHKQLPQLQHQHSTKILSNQLLQDFLNEDFLGENASPYEASHLLSIFDYINELLEEYRPFYQSNGEQFPWSVQLFTSMSEYSITEDSVQIIFRQIKDKIVDNVSLLAGIIVEGNEEKDLVKTRRQEKQNVMVTKWVEEHKFDKNHVQVEATIAMDNVGFLIEDLLLIELCQELGYLI